MSHSFLDQNCQKLCRSYGWHFGKRGFWSCSFNRESWRLPWICKILQIRSEINESGEKPNAFELMMHSAKKTPDTSRNNSEFELYNAIINFLKEGDLGWKMESLHLGEHFVGVPCDALCLLNPRRRKLNDQQCGIPSMPDIFVNLNDPRKHKHLPWQISNELLIISQLFSI